MRGDACPCVALREKSYLRCGFSDKTRVKRWCAVLFGFLASLRSHRSTRTPHHRFTRGPVWVLGVVALPPLKFGAGLVSGMLPDVGSRDLLSGFVEHLFNVRVHRRAPALAVRAVSDAYGAAHELRKDDVIDIYFSVTLSPLTMQLFQISEHFVTAFVKSR